jgi:hypothetical protein
VFAPIRTLVVAFVPIRSSDLQPEYAEGDSLWRQATMLEHMFYMLPTPSIQVSTNRRTSGHMIVDTRKLTAILERELPNQ